MKGERTLSVGDRPAAVDGVKGRGHHGSGVNVECVLFGPLRESVGEKTLRLDLDDGATVADLLERLADEHEDLAFFDDGGLRGDRTITVDRRDVRHLDGLATPLSEDDTVRLTTAVYGGGR